MSRVADEPLEKVTLNLYAEDVEWARRRHGFGYTEAIRRAVRRWRRQIEEMEGD